MLRHGSMLLVAAFFVTACGEGEIRAQLQAERAENARLASELKLAKEALADLRRQCDDNVQAREADAAAKEVEDWTRSATIEQEVRRELQAETARNDELLRAERERQQQREAAIRYHDAILAEAERERARRAAEESDPPPPR